MQRNVLDLIRNLNDEAIKLKEEKWKIEENLLSLERKIHELKAPPLKKEIGKLEFTEKMTELGAKIKSLESDSNTQASGKACREVLETCTKKYTDILAALKEVTAKLDAQNLNIRGNDGDKTLIHEVHKDLNKIENLQERLSTIASLDGKITLKIIRNLFDRILHLNEKGLIQAFQKATGKDLIQEHINKELLIKSKPADVTFDMICKKLLSMESVVDTFKNFTKQDSKDITDERLAEKMRAIAKDFEQKAHSILKIKKIKNEDADQSFLCYFITELYLLFTIETYRFTDDIQMGVKLSQAAFTQLSLNEIINPFLIIPMIANSISVFPSSAIKKLLREITILLKGLYERSVQQVPFYLKGPDGKLLPQAYQYIGDKEDADFYYWKPPLTKTAMGVYYEKHFDVLIAKLPHLSAKLKPVVIPEKNASASAIAAEKKEEQPLSISAPSPDKILQPTEMPAANNSIEMKTTKPSPLAMLNLHAQKPQQNVPRAELPFSELDDIKNHPSGVKFSMLKSYLKIYDLNEKQKRVIKDYKEAIIEGLNSYIDSRFTTHGLPNLGIYPLSRPYSALMKAAKEDIEQSDDPAFYVRRLCKLYVKLGTADSSLGTVTTLLENLFLMLHSASKPAQEMMQKNM